ncbi:hypothetical protein GE21DRAFT_1063268 [Neurospora crassa]|nr:hypothetical protein GE21DRAFT_1063268 [Neurospora crassa]
MMHPPFLHIQNGQLRIQLVKNQSMTLSLAILTYLQSQNSGTSAVTHLVNLQFFNDSILRWHGGLRTGSDLSWNQVLVHICSGWRFAVLPSHSLSFSSVLDRWTQRSKAKSPLLFIGPETSPALFSLSELFRRATLFIETRPLYQHNSFVHGTSPGI